MLHYVATSSGMLFLLSRYWHKHSHPLRGRGGTAAAQSEQREGAPKAKDRLGTLYEVANFYVANRNIEVKLLLQPRVAALWYQR